MATDKWITLSEAVYQLAGVELPGPPTKEEEQRRADIADWANRHQLARRAKDRGGARKALNKLRQLGVSLVDDAEAKRTHKEARWQVAQWVSNGPPESPWLRSPDETKKALEEAGQRIVACVKNGALVVRGKPFSLDPDIPASEIPDVVTLCLDGVFLDLNRNAIVSDWWASEDLAPEDADKRFGRTAGGYEDVLLDRKQVLKLSQRRQPPSHRELVNCIVETSDGKMKEEDLRTAVAKRLNFDIKDGQRWRDALKEARKDTRFKRRGDGRPKKSDNEAERLSDIP